MKSFLQVVSLFGLPVAVLIWYDLYTKSGTYLQSYGSEASRFVALGIYLATALLCLHLPLRLWRRFDAMSLRLFCLTASLVTFWVAVKLAASGRVGEAPLMKSALVFLIPVLMYALLRHFLFRWSRSEIAEPGATSARDASDSPETPSKHEHGHS